MKHLDTLFRKIFGREKDTTPIFDEDALWDSIVEDLGPKNSIVPNARGFTGWIPLSMVFGVVLFGVIYYTVNTMHSDGLNIVVNTDSSSFQEGMDRTENHTIGNGKLSNKIDKSDIDDNSISIDAQSKKVSSGRNGVVDNFEFSSAKSTATFIDNSVSLGTKKKGEILESPTKIERIPAKPEEMFSSNSANNIASVTESSAVDAKFAEGASESSRKSATDGAIQEIDEATLEKQTITIGNEDETSLFKDTEDRLSLSESISSAAEFKANSLERLFPQPIKGTRSVMPQMYINEKGIEPEYTFQRKKQNWNYRVGAYSGANLTDAVFGGTPVEIVSSKNTTETIGLGTQFGLDFSMIYSNSWSITTGLSATTLHTIFKDKSNLTIIEEDHVVDGIILSQNNQILDEFSKLTNLERNVYRANVHNNFYQTISIPLLIGWERKLGQSKYGLRAGSQVSYRLLQNGKTLDSEGIYRGFDSTENLLLKPWNVDLVGEVWLSVPVSAKLSICGAYHFKTTQSNILGTSDIRARVLNHQLRAGVNFDF